MTSRDEAVQGAVPEATIARLPRYLRALQGLADRGVERVSSTELAEVSGVQSALVRRDFSHLGSYGTRGVGYEVPVLVREIGDHVGNGRNWPVVIVGVGNMGRALARFLGSRQDGFQLVSLVDANPDVVGREVAGVVVEGQARLDQVLAMTRPRIGIITTPAPVAQEICDALHAGGVRRILNFAPTPLVAPPGCTIRSVDLSQELHILAFHEARSLAQGPIEEIVP